MSARHRVGDPSGDSVVHVVQGGPCLAAFVAELARKTASPTVFVGTLAGERDARVAGLAPVATFSPPLGETVLGLRSWRRVLQTVWAAHPAIDRATCWSTSTAAATRRAMPTWKVTLGCAGGPEPSLGSALMSGFASFRPANAVAISDLAASACRGGGPGGGCGSFGDGVTTAVSRIPPSVRGELLRRDREQIRRRWSARTTDVVIGLLGEPADAVDARRAADVVGIAAVRGLPVRLVFHPHAARAERTWRWISEVDVKMFLTRDVALARPWEVVAGLDAAIVLRDAVTVAGAASRSRGWLRRSGREVAMSPLPACWAAAAGIPILAERGALDDSLAKELGATVFEADDPLAATRELLAIARCDRHVAVTGS